MFRFIEAEKERFPVGLMCQVLEVSRSGFYAWLARPRSQRALDDELLTEQIRAIHAQSRRTYGAPRIQAALKHAGCRHSRKRVARLMRCAGIQGAHRRRRSRTTIQDRSTAPAPDLVERNFKAPAPDRLWVADITYIRTWQGWLYLAIVLDAFSRKIVGWAMRDDLRTELVVEALEMALWNRKPASGLVHHSDRGCQYTSFVFGRRCQQAGVMPSMGSTGDAYDNSLAESFFATLETEWLWQHIFRTRREARLAIFDFIEVFYNRQRLHSRIGDLPPAEFERRWRETSEGVSVA